MTLALLSLVLGIVPMLVYAFVVWRLDRFEREPLPLLVAAFFWGAVPAVIFAIIAQTILGIPVRSGIPEEFEFYAQLYEASLVAPFTEELLKALGLVYLFTRHRREIDSVLDGLVYGSMIGFGFAAVENVLYFLGESDPGGLFVLFFLRAFVFGMLHALFTGLVGVGFALGKFSRLPLMRVLWPLLGLALAMATHALHNYFATVGGAHLLYAVIGTSIGIAWFAAMVTVCLWHENRWIRFHLAEEVTAGTLFAEQAEDAASFWARSSLSGLGRGFATVRRRARLLHEATELAFEKQRQIRFHPGPDCAARLARLRDRVRQLSREDPLYLQGKISAERLLPPPLPPVRQPPPPLPPARRPPPLPK